MIMRAWYGLMAGMAAVAFAAHSLRGFSAQLAKGARHGKRGKAVGDVDLVQTPSGVLFRLSVKGLAPGERAFHVHEVGKCEAPFESAGAHFNPAKDHHGMMSGRGHAGDMPNLHIPQSGE